MNIKVYLVFSIGGFCSMIDDDSVDIVAALSGRCVRPWFTFAKHPLSITE